MNKFYYKSSILFLVIISLSFLIYEIDIKKLLINLFNTQHKHFVLTKIQNDAKLLQEKEIRKDHRIVTSTAQLFMHNIIESTKQKQLNFSLTTIDENRIYGQKIFLTYISLTGNFVSVSSFLRRLADFSSPIFFTNLAIQVLPNNLLRVAAKLFCFEKNTQLENLNYQKFQNEVAFCLLNQAHNNAMMSHQLLSLNNLNLMAIVAYASKKEAWIMFPNHHLMAVTQGMVLGPDKLRVQNITDHELMLATQTGFLHRLII